MKRLLLLILAGLLFIPSFMFKMEEASAQWWLFQNPILGKEVQDFTLGDLSGEQKSFDALRKGQPAILFFWTTWCPHCRIQLEMLNESADDIEAKGIKIILIDLGEDGRKVRRYIDSRNYKFDVLLDENGEAADQFNVEGIPTFVYINKKGTVLAVEHEIIGNYEEILLNE
ncbi:MAG: TlpA disulfide reductase family protein [Candidatus Omnitrophota bacterium]